MRPKKRKKETVMVNIYKSELPIMGRGMRTRFDRLTLKVPEKLLLYGLYVYYVVHICDFGMLRIKKKI